MNRIRSFLLVGVCVATGWANQAALGAVAQKKCDRREWSDVHTVPAQILRIVDGDTANVEIDGVRFNVRFLSIDTPETHFEGKSQGRWGDLAAQRLAELLPVGSNVSVELDVEKCDSYGRMLGYIWKKNENISLTMLKEGLAVNYCIYPNVLHCEEYAEAVAESVSEGRGIFGRNGVEIPYIWRKKVSNRPFDKYAGNIYSHRVYQPNAVKDIPVAERIFFWDDTKELPHPYRWAND